MAGKVKVSIHALNLVNKWLSTKKDLLKAEAFLCAGEQHENYTVITRSLSGLRTLAAAAVSSSSLL